MREGVYIHPSAHVDEHAEIGKGSKIWINTQVREGAKVGRNCIISKDVYLDHGISIGDNCKVQNSVSIYAGVTIEDDVFVGPNASFTNDRVPRAFNADWGITPTLVRKGASIGANATIVCGTVLGEYCMIAAGAVVTKDVPPYAVMMGNPARCAGYVNMDGSKRESKIDG